MMRFIYLCAFLCAMRPIVAQQDLESLFVEDSIAAEKNKLVTATFKGSRIVNLHSNESIKKHELASNISHRFGYFLGPYGGLRTFYGMDNSSDIKISLDYGISNKLAVGLARVKGATAITEVYEVSLKYKLMEQTVLDEKPISITLYGNTGLTSMKSNVKENVPDYFPAFEDRMSFLMQGIFTRKFNRHFSLAILPSYVHYNRVMHDDQNDTYSVGAGARLKLTNRCTIVADYVYVIRPKAISDYFSSNNMKFYNPLGVGIELETGGHVFNIHFSNTAALLENQFIPYTSTSWRNNGYRLGFNISRVFSLAKKKKA
jgi:hypothetical protein